MVPSQDESVPERFPWIPVEACSRAVQVVAPDGRTWSGADAVEYLTRVLPWGGAVGWIFEVPGSRLVADRIYRWIAARRGSASCGLHCQ